MIQPVRRAFVGFSSPVGYSYKYPAPKTVNDDGSSPNPVLMGSTGLFTLYDEIWFACESLCPKNMRELSYIRFLDVERPDIVNSIDQVINDCKKSAFPGDADINDLFPGGYRDMDKFYEPDGRVDNHTHGLKFGDGIINGNPGAPQLAIDTWLVAASPELSLELALNPITAKLAFDGDQEDTWPLKKETYDNVVIADSLISIKNLYDFTGPEGPYHDYIETLRQDDLVGAFRTWIAGQKGRLDNQTLQQIQEDVDARVDDVRRKALSAYSDRYRFKNVVVDLIKSTVAPNVPWSAVDLAGRLPHRKAQLAYTFVARADLSRPA